MKYFLLPIANCSTKLLAAFIWDKVVAQIHRFQDFSALLNNRVIESNDKKWNRILDIGTKMLCFIVLIYEVACSKV